MQKLLQIKLSVSIIKQGKRYIAHSPALDLSTSGKSGAEAKKRFAEAVDIFFEELMRAGTLDDVLKGLGWEKEKKQWQPPKEVSHGLQSFRVPVAA